MERGERGERERLACAQPREKGGGGLKIERRWWNWVRGRREGKESERERESLPE